MIPEPFSYVRARTYEEAVAVLVEKGPEARVMSGGQSLMPLMNLRLARPGVVVDVSRLGASDSIATDGSRIHLPGTTRLQQLIASPVVHAQAPLLSAAAAHTGNRRVRNLGTIGGNLAHGDPASEVAGAVLALGGSVEVIGPDGARTIPIEKLLVSDYTTSLGPAEIIRSVRVPVRAPASGHGFEEVVRRHGDFAVVYAAASVTPDDAGRIGAVALACGGVGARILDAAPLIDRELIGDALVGGSAAADGFAAAADRVMAAVSPRTDVHGSGAYRKRLVAVCVRRALTAAVEEAKRSRG